LLVYRLKHAWKYFKRDGPVWVARVTADHLVQGLYRLLPPPVYMSLRMFFRLGYWPNIYHPRSLNEKMVHRMLFISNPLYSLVADKWRVREYVAQRGLAYILNEVYWVGNNPEEIPFNDLPDQFVIKANHGCHWNILVTDKSTLNRQLTIRQCRKWLFQKFSKVSRLYESYYDSIQPLILVERFLKEEKHDALLDYKFLCFHGVPKYIYVVDNSGDNPTLTFYDTNWNQLNIRYVFPIGRAIRQPTKLTEMLEIAAQLSKDFDFVRIDLYAPNDRTIIAGEITLAPTSGFGPFYPRVWDFRLGELW